MRVLALIVLLCLCVSSSRAESSSLPAALAGVDWKKAATEVSNDAAFQESVRVAFGLLTADKRQAVTESIGWMKAGRGYPLTGSPVDAIVAKALAEKLAPLIVDDGAKEELGLISSKGDMAALLAALTGTPEEPEAGPGAPSNDELIGFFHSPQGNGSGCYAFFIDEAGLLSGLYFDGNPASYAMITGKKPGRRADASYTCGYTGLVNEMRITPDRNGRFKVEQEIGDRKESYLISKVSPENLEKTFAKAKGGPLTDAMKGVLERLASIR